MKIVHNGPGSTQETKTHCEPVAHLKEEGTTKPQTKEPRVLLPV